MIFKTLLARENWETKYRYGDETPLQTFQRVSKAVAEVEKNYGATKQEISRWNDTFLKTLIKFIPCEDDTYEGEDLYIDLDGERFIADGLKCTTGGRITANAGTSFDKATLLNCFINSPVSSADITYNKRVSNTDVEINCDLNSEQTPDNLTNIFLSLLEAAETLKSEGGYGLNFGFIRPRGSFIEGVGIRHPGVVSYMELWDKMSEMIVRGVDDGYHDSLSNYLEEDTKDKIEKVMPRKGAMLAALPIWHPDIEEFVKAKQEKGVLTKFNISVLIDDAFMEAVDADDFYDLHFNGKVYKKIKARELYDLIMECTYNRNEPGVLFFDNMNRQNPLVYLGPVSASNPCVAEGTLVATEKGLVPVEDVKVGDKIQTTLGFSSVSSIEVHEDYPVHKVTFSDGTTLRVTEGHIFHIWNELEQEWNKNQRLMDLSPKDITDGVYIRKESYKFKNAPDIGESGKVKVESIIPDGKATVYDLYEPEADDWNTHGIISRGCGEIPGTSFVDKHYKPAPYLKPYMDEWDDHLIGFTTVCLLGSLNLTQYIGKDRTFDFDQYKDDIDIFARMLENVNDIGAVPLPAYEWSLKNIRQYGMGVNGLGSAHFMLGLRYGSDDGNSFVQKIQQIKDDQTLRSSALLAKDRGPFPMYDERYLETPYFKYYCSASEETKDLVRKYGLRNSKRLTNPPLGNSSVICDMVSNGIEPVFSFGYERTYIASKWPEGLTRDNIKDLLDEIEVNDSVAWRGTYDGRVCHYEPHNRGLCFVEQVEDYGYSWVKDYYPKDVDDGADYLITAQELKVLDHVLVQEQVQKSCDQSVSKTSNLPEDYPFEDFKGLYKKAWKANLIGFTTYRDGTMENVLASTDGKDNTIKAKSLLDLLRHFDALKKDAEVTEDGVIVKDVSLPNEFSNGNTVKIKADGNKYYLHLSYLPDDVDYPVALWVHTNHLEEGEYVSLNRGVKAITRLLLDKGVEFDLVYEQLEKIKDDSHHTRLGKMISMALRHNIGVLSVVRALTDIEGDYIASTLTAVRKFLSQHVEDGTKVTGASCNACSSTDIVYESGCSLCRSCGSSECG